MQYTLVKFSFKPHPNKAMEGTKGEKEEGVQQRTSGVSLTDTLI